MLSVQGVRGCPTLPRRLHHAAQARPSTCLECVGRESVAECGKQSIFSDLHARRRALTLARRKKRKKGGWGSDDSTLDHTFPFSALRVGFGHCGQGSWKARRATRKRGQAEDKKGARQSRKHAGTRKQDERRTAKDFLVRSCRGRTSIRSSRSNFQKTACFFNFVSLSAKAMPPFSCIALPCVSGSWQDRLFNAPYLFGFKHGKHT